MSTLFGYKTKVVRDGLYEVFEPVADARYLLAIAFERAFMIKREQRSKNTLPYYSATPSNNNQGGGTGQPPKNAVNISTNKNNLQVAGAAAGGNGASFGGDQQHLSILNATRQGSASRSPVRAGGN